MVIHGTMNVYGHIYGCQETMNLNFFQSFNRDFSPLKYVTGTYFTLLQPTFEISYGQEYGCQVFLVTIYGLDMVAKIYLWWSTWAHKQFHDPRAANFAEHSRNYFQKLTI